MDFGNIEPRCPPGAVRPEGFGWATHQVELPAGATNELALNPSYWAHHCRAFRPGDLLKVTCSDGTWEGDYRVRFVSEGEVKTVQLRYKSFDEEIIDAPEVDSHSVKWISPTAKYGVVTADGHVVKDHLYPKAEAYNFLRKHLQGLAA